MIKMGRLRKRYTEAGRALYDKNGTSQKAVLRRDARCTIKMGRLRRRYRGGTEAGRAMYDKNGTFENTSRGGTEAIPQQDARCTIKRGRSRRRDRPPRLAYKNVNGRRGGVGSGVLWGRV